MASWSKNKTLPANINGGNEYTVEDNVSLQNLNAITNNSFYAMDKAEDAYTEAHSAFMNNGTVVSVGGTAQPTLSFDSDPQTQISSKITYEEKTPTSPINPFANYYTKSQTVNLVSNPNLLINGDFKINQRASHTPSAGSYCYDRWKNWVSSVSITKDISSNSLKIVVSGTGNVLQQYLELDDCKKLYGKTLTLSTEVSADGGTFTKYSATKINLASASDFAETDIIGGAKLHFGTDANGYIYSQLMLTDNQTIYVKYMKLEIGDTATPLSPRPYAEELALCQRYYLKISGTGGVENLFGLGFVTSSSTGRLYVATPSSLRTAPTITVDGLGMLNLNSGTSYSSNLTLSLVTVNLNLVCLGISRSGSSLGSAGNILNVYGATATAYIGLDAEIY